MEPHGKIYFNGELTEFPAGTGAERLLSSNYVYAAVNTAGHRPLFLGRHLHFACESYAKLYGQRPEIDPDTISALIPELLYHNRMPRGCCTVTIYLLPGAAKGRIAKPDIIMAAGQSTIYAGYELHAIRPKAVVVNYDIPFSGHRTAVSLTAAEYMAGFAERSGASLPVRANRAGNIVSAGEYPVFAIKGGKVLAPDSESGAGDSLERELMMWLCEREGLAVEERGIPVTELSKVDELIVFGPYGLQSVLSCGEAYFYSVTALALEKHLAAITEEGLYSPPDK